MAEIIPFERIKVFHNPSIAELRDFAKKHGWKNFTVDWNGWLKTNKVTMTRLPV